MGFIHPPDATALPPPSRQGGAPAKNTGMIKKYLVLGDSRHGHCRNL